MARVKASKPERLKVVPHRPYQKAGIIAGVVMGLLLVASASYYLGHARGGQHQDRVVAERDRLRTELQAKTAEMERLSQKVANLSLAREVDQASNEDVRHQVIELREQISKLEEDIAFYRGLMAPTENKQGLTIGSMEVVSLGMPGRYEYKVVVQQLATNHQVLNGYLNFNIVGRQGDAIRSIPLQQVSPQVDVKNIKLRFKYFQNIAGQLELPAGFEPERIELLAKSTSDGVVVEKNFSWLVQES